MPGRLAPHAPTVTAGLAMLFIASSLGYLFPPPSSAASGAIPAENVEAIELPRPRQDDDHDSYRDRDDRWEGDALVEVELRRLNWPGSGVEPYVLAGSQDDHARTGAGAELAWRHLVDHDPLGRKAGSPAWQHDAIRTGTWVTTLAGAGLERAAATSGALGSGGDPTGALWPQSLILNVRDDRDQVRIDIEAWDAGQSPHKAGGAWRLVLDVNGSIELPDGSWVAANESLRVGVLAGADDEAGLEVRLVWRLDLDAFTKAELANRWAPELRFDSQERFFPVPGEMLEAFHGFARPEPDLRTWTLEFNGGRDHYRLLLADFDGNRRVDHEDAALMSDVLAKGGTALPTVYSHVIRAANGHVVVQYWFLSFYNFVRDEAGRDVEALAHAGDREFIQLVFADEQQARNGTPESITYSQHYEGIRISQPSLQGTLFNGTHPLVFVARGSHASYPAPGDDRGLRPAFSGFHDVFDGLGPTWTTADYDLEILGNQTWHMGYLWGPATRHGRDLGTSRQPLLAHDFRYPYSDPLHWQASIDAVAESDVAGLYGGGP